MYSTPPSSSTHICSWGGGHGFRVDQSSDRHSPCFWILIGTCRSTCTCTPQGSNMEQAELSRNSFRRLLLIQRDICIVFFKSFSFSISTLQQKSHLCIPFLGIAQLQFPHSCVCEWFIFPGSVHIFGCSKIDRLILEIYKSLTDILV